MEMMAKLALHISSEWIQYNAFFFNFTKGKGVENRTSFPCLGIRPSDPHSESLE